MDPPLDLYYSPDITIPMFLLLPFPSNTFLSYCVNLQKLCLYLLIFKNDSSNYFWPYTKIPEHSCALHLLSEYVILLWGTIICALRSQDYVVIESGGLESLSRFGIWLSHLLCDWESYVISLYFSFLICKIGIVIELSS